MAAMSSTCETILQQAVARHRQGDALAAEPLYRAVLAEQPAHGEANHGLGLLLAERGADAQSLPFFQAALKAQPGIWQHWLSYACLLYTSPSPRDRTRSRMPSSA